jgi:hypothetical protein
VGAASCRERLAEKSPIRGWKPLPHETRKVATQPDMPGGFPGADYLRKIADQVERLKDITGKLMCITRYETAEYFNGSKIVDIDRLSSDKGILPILFLYNHQSKAIPQLDIGHWLLDIQYSL